MLADSCGPDADKEFWEGAVKFSLGDVSTYALNPTDQLLHVCAHGARWESPPALQWAADAIMIMRSAESEIDWHRLVRQVGKHRLVLPLRDTLTYLRDVLDAPIPSLVLQSLQVMPITELERLEYEARTSPSPARGPWGELRFMYRRYSLLMHAAALPPRLAGFPRFYMVTCGLEHLWQLPLFAVRRTAHRIGEMSVWYLAGSRNRYSRR